MLSKLYIENIAVIERAEIDFSRGFNVLTGETGAGKSILVDSINAVLGQRTSRELIRTGADIVSRTTDIPPEFVSIIQGIIIVLVAAEMFLSGFKRRLIFNSAKKALAEKEGKA